MPAMIVEPLDARRLFAGGVADRTYGTDGLAALGTSATDTGPVLAVDAGTFVAQTLADNAGYAITKLTAAGRLDAAWGDGGHATVAFKPDKLAYDKRTDSLYAAVVVVGKTADALDVLRLTAAGKADSTFGTGGTAAYAPGLSPSFDALGVTVGSLNVLRNGVIAGVRLQGSTAYGGGEESNASSGGSSDFSDVLVKFRPGGAPINCSAAAAWASSGSGKARTTPTAAAATSMTATNPTFVSSRHARTAVLT